MLECQPGPVPTKRPCSPLSSATETLEVTCCDWRTAGWRRASRPASDFVNECDAPFLGYPPDIGVKLCDCSPAWPRLTPPRCPTASPSNLFPEEEHGPLILPKTSEPLRLPRPFHLAPSQFPGTHLLTSSSPPLPVTLLRSHHHSPGAMPQPPAGLLSPFQAPAFRICQKQLSETQI